MDNFQLGVQGHMTWITTRLTYKSGMAWIYEAGAFLVSPEIEMTQKWHRSQIEAASKRKRCQIKVSRKLTRHTFSHHLGALVWFCFLIFRIGPISKAKSRRPLMTLRGRP